MWSLKGGGLPKEWSFKGGTTVYLSMPPSQYKQFCMGPLTVHLLKISKYFHLSITLSLPPNALTRLVLADKLLTYSEVFLYFLLFFISFFNNFLSYAIYFYFMVQSIYPGSIL